MRLELSADTTNGGADAAEREAGAGRMARGVLWLGTENHKQESVASLAGTTLLGSLHGARLLELMNAAGIGSDRRGQNGTHPPIGCPSS
jgi:hypothetical protein